MTQSPELEVHQALHGYGDDGHQLLRSSARLSSAHESQLLLLSDLSGPEFRPDFDGYLTGYGLNGSGYYVLARTWFASEMPRPGCVWTHSLLFRDEDLSRIRSLSHLPFRRPVATDPSEVYEGTLRVELDGEWARVDPSPELKGVLSALYSGDSTVVVSAGSAAAQEQVVLAVFLQQWPRLRRSFRFCTGALLPRDRSFDLVMTPREALLGVERREGFVVVTHEAASAGPSWLARALSDLSTPDSNYRLFLWRFGPDFSNGRRAFAFLTRTYIQISRSPDEQIDIPSLLDELQSIAPNPTDAQRLKAALFGDHAAFSFDADEPILRWYLRGTSSCLDAQTVAIQTRVERLARAAPNELAALLLQSAGSDATNRCYEEFARACLAAVRSGALRLRAWEADAILRLIAIAPEMVTSPEIWERSTEQQAQLFALVGPQISNTATRLQLQVAFLKGDKSLLSELAFTSWPTESINALLAVLDEDHGFELPRQAKVALLHSHDLLAAVVTEAQLGPGALRFCAAYLDAGSAAARSIPIVTWFPCARSGISLNEPSLELKASVFFLVMGLRATRVDASRLVAESFMRVHEATSAERIANAEWNLIDRELPLPSYGWDRCKWLVRGVVDRFVDRHWPVAEFTATFGASATWRRAVRHLRRSRGGLAYLSDLRHANAAGALALDAEQAATLQDDSWW